jgi:hypothetical protein
MLLKCLICLHSRADAEAVVFVALPTARRLCRAAAPTYGSRFNPICSPAQVLGDEGGVPAADHQQTRGAAAVPAGAGTIPGRPPCWNALRVLKPLPVVHRGFAPGAWTGAGGCRRRHAAPEVARPLQASDGCPPCAADSMDQRNGSMQTTARPDQLSRAWLRVKRGNSITSESPRNFTQHDRRDCASRPQASSSWSSSSSSAGASCSAP